MYETCRVCGEPTSEYSQAVCSQCTATYHLALRQDIPAKDCGQVWINEQNLSLEFACNICLGAAGEIEVGAPPAADAGPRPARRRYVRREGVGAAELLRARRRRDR